MIRSPRAKGRRVEHLVVKMLQDMGLFARRQPLSGAIRDFPHDVYAKLPDGDLICEVKARAKPPQVILNWLGKADVLFIKPNNAPFTVHMSEDTWRRLIAMVRQNDAAR